MARYWETWPAATTFLLQNQSPSSAGGRGSSCRNKKEAILLPQLSLPTSKTEAAAGPGKQWADYFNYHQLQELLASSPVKNNSNRSDQLLVGWPILISSLCQSSGLCLIKQSHAGLYTATSEAENR